MKRKNISYWAQIYIGRVLINDLINDKFKVTNVDLKIYPDQNQNLNLKIELKNI